MKLNDAIITNFLIDGVDYSNNIKLLLQTLLNSHCYKAELVINNRVIPAGVASFSLNSGWLYANVSTKLSFGESVHSDSLLVRVYDNGGETFIESTTNNMFTVNDDDVAVSLWIKVGSLFPYNELKCVIPNSNFISMGTKNIPVKMISEYEQNISEITDDEDEEENTENPIVEDNPETQEEHVEENPTEENPDANVDDPVEDHPVEEQPVSPVVPEQPAEEQNGGEDSSVDTTEE